MIPSVNLTQKDGGLGLIPVSSGNVLAIIAAATSGTVGRVARYSRVTDVTTDYTSGPLVEAAAYVIKNYGIPVILCRAAAGTNLGGYGTIDITHVAGTCDPANDATTHPVDEFDIKVLVVVGGTVASAGITYKYSLDGGLTYSKVLALGTATSITISEAGAKFTVASGTLVAGDYWTVRTTAPLWTSSELDDALEAIGRTSLPWNTVLVCGTCGATDIQALDTFCAAQSVGGNYRSAICNLLRPVAGDDEADYLDDCTTATSSVSTTWVNVCAGYALIKSGVSSRQYARPIAVAVAGRLTKCYLGQDAAEVDMGPIPGVSLVGVDGEPLEEGSAQGCIHNESLDPGLDDLRLTTLRTVPGYQGTYINNCRILCPTGSDFVYQQFRDVMNAACAAVNPELTRRLSKGTRLNKSGTILESDALDIEVGAKTVLSGVLLTKPSVSSAVFVLSRVDNVLSTQTYTGDVSVVPLGYPKAINVTMQFNNPAIRAA